MLRHHNVSQNEQGGLRAKVAEAQKTLQDALYTADVVSKDQDKTIKEHEGTIEKMQKTMDELKKAIETERKATEEEKKATEKEKEKTDAQAREIELLQAKVTMLEENLATKQRTLEQRVADAEDKYTDLAWYRVWTYNPNADFDFLGSEKERLFALWEARLEEEELDNVSLSTHITKDDYTQDISSKTSSQFAPKGKSTLDAEIDAMLGDSEVDLNPIIPSEEKIEVARQETVQNVGEALAEPASEAQDPPALVEPASEAQDPQAKA